MGTYRHYQHGEPIVAASQTTAGQMLLQHEAISVHDASATSDVTPQIDIAKEAAGWPTVGSTVHTLCTSNGSPYVNFQNRVMYATYKKAQNMPGGEIHVGFTRILHRTVEDELMEVGSTCAHSGIVCGNPAHPVLLPLELIRDPYQSWCRRFRLSTRCR